MDKGTTSQNGEIEQNAIDESDIKIPWHFWLIVSLAGIYLGFRLIEFTVLGFKAIF